MGSGKGKSRRVRNVVSATAVVRPGWYPDDWVLGDASHERWHQGGCTALALAIHERTGWLIYGIDFGGPHYVVKTSDGQMLDHRGLQPWPRSVTYADPEDVGDVKKEAMKWGPPADYPDAGQVADQLLRGV